MTKAVAGTWPREVYNKMGEEAPEPGKVFCSRQASVSKNSWGLLLQLTNSVKNQDVTMLAMRAAPKRFDLES